MRGDLRRRKESLPSLRETPPSWACARGGAHTAALPPGGPGATRRPSPGRQRHGVGLKLPTGAARCLNPATSGTPPPLTCCRSGGQRPHGPGLKAVRAVEGRGGGYGAQERNPWRQRCRGRGYLWSAAAATIGQTAAAAARAASVGPGAGSDGRRTGLGATQAPKQTTCFIDDFHKLAMSSMMKDSEPKHVRGDRSQARTAAGTGDGRRAGRWAGWRATCAWRGGEGWRTGGDGVRSRSKWRATFVSRRMCARPGELGRQTRA